MNLNRRNLLKQLGTGIAASSLFAPRRSSAHRRESPSDSEALPQHLAPTRLDRTENAYGASPKAIAAIEGTAKGTSRYLESSILLKTLADHHRDRKSTR